jgi:hypothetical protein
MRTRAGVVAVFQLIAVVFIACAAEGQQGATAPGASAGGGAKSGVASPAESLSKALGTEQVRGRYLDRRVADRAATVKQVAYAPSQGVVVKVHKSEVAPAAARPGDVVEARVEYEALAPDPQERVPVKERRAFEKDGKAAMEAVERQLRRSQGVHISTYRFRIPADLKQGKYTVTTVLEVGEKESAKRLTAEAAFTVE